MGGDAKVISRLDTFFTQLNAGPNQPYYWAGNEIDLSAPYMYDYVGAPYKTQALVRKITSTLYSATPGGEPGNDDLGAMSSWLVWADLGLYPETAGAPVLVAGSPLFPRAVVHLPSGAALTIDGVGAAADAPYVTGLAVDGTPTQMTSVSVASLLPYGANLRFSLSATPDPAWGSAPADAPPSYSAGEAPVVLTSSGQTTVAPGSSVTTGLLAANATGYGQAVNWSATPAAGSGVSALPDAGSATVPAGGSTIPVTLHAAPEAGPGFSTVSVAATDDNRPVPTGNIPVLVAVPGSLLAAFDNIGISDESDPMAADFDGDGYSYSAQALAAAGVTPGSAVHAGAADYTWPDVAAGQPDNAVAGGQTVTVNAPAGATALDVLCSATNGPSTGTVTLTYADGSTASAPLRVSDWTLNGGSASPEPGNTVAIAMSGRNSASGASQGGATDVFSVAVPLNPSLRLARVTLPAATTAGQIHVFALATS
ncbi:glycoside hydrolase family 92 protein [Acidiferrimicrobium sp. IK]|nr:glycoside hydrolase family 92 protein [Acidiferrimicrobium sp. IK]